MIYIPSGRKIQILFYDKDPGDYANYKEDHHMARE
jgi:hypothetical protein